MSLVRVRDLVHRYDREPVVAVPELDLDRGRVHLAGANGAGKTTLLSILATLVTPTRGRVEVAGCDLSERARAARARVGYLGHEPSLHEALPARQALALHARLHDLPETRVDEALHAWGLADRGKAQVAELSFGQRRRLDLARALLHEPRVVLLDEPSTGLDADARERLDAELDDLDPELVLVASPGDPAITTDERVELSGGEIVEASS